MFKDKRSIYIIAFSLVGLLAMQGMWLYYAINQEKRFLNTSTRQAAIEALASIEQKEDSRILVANFDSILNLDENLPELKNHHKSNSEVKVIISASAENSNIHIDNNADSGVKTSYSYTTTTTNKNGATNVQIIRTTNESKGIKPDVEKVKARIKNYEQLLKKIVLETNQKNVKIEDRLNFNELTGNVYKNLASRGINIKPELAVKNKSDSTVFKTPGFIGIPAVVLPMFTKDIVSKNYTLNLFYPSTVSYIFKKAIGVIVLSFFVTLLLITVILLLYKKMLSEQKLNQYKNDFINNLTHELKTPLATISLANANINKLAGYSKTEGLNEYTRIIEEENKKLNNHIEKVFELSLLEKEKQIFTTETIDLTLFLEKFAEQTSVVLQSKNATLKLLLNASETRIKADSFHLTNMMNNLLDNSVKYSRETPVIEISTKNSGKNLLLSIKDNGIGINKEHQKYIFDKFFRVTNKNLHDTKGFGIGLSYVKQVVELLGGSIAIASEENSGTEFIITLPYVES